MNKNKFSFKIKLIGEKILRLQIIHWDSRFLSYVDSKNSANDNFVYYVAPDNSFSLYSQDDGYIIGESPQCLVLPNSDYMKPGYIIEHNFDSDFQRKTFLKTLYKILPKWANQWEGFDLDIYDDKNIIVHKNFWVF